MNDVRSAEADVEKQRVVLERTLGALRKNLQPSHLLQEALSGGQWFDRLQRFARKSPISWTVMTVAALGVGIQTSRRFRR